MVKNIDVFWYLEELLIKKDLDNDDWYHARTNHMVLGLVNGNFQELVEFIKVGEKVSTKQALISVDKFVKEIKRDLSKNKKDEPIDVGGEDYD